MTLSVQKGKSVTKHKNTKIIIYLLLLFTLVQRKTNVIYLQLYKYKVILAGIKLAYI